MAYVRVAINAPLHQLFDYGAGDATAQDIGARVLVPFGRKRTVGVILALEDQSALPESQVKPAIQIYRDRTGVPRDVLDMLEFAADYYVHPLGAAIFLALPPALRRARSLADPAPTLLRLTAAGRAAIPPASATRQRALLESLKAVESLAPARLKDGGAARIMNEFLKRGWLERVAQEGDTSLPQSIPGPALTEEQAAAVRTIGARLDHFGVWLLHGITGSGKTEVYLRLAAQALAQSGQVLVLVPEIGLTPQLEARFRARFPGARQVSLHSNIADVERAQRWLAAARGEARIVLGTRLAVFTPMPALRLIVVDEEHDASFKQHEGLRYGARDLAIYRAKLRRVPVLLGSATPSLESYQQALSGRFELLKLTRRALERARLPSMRLVSLREEKPDQGLSEALRRAIAERLERGEQTLVFINRRGFAPVLYCQHCAWTSGCPRCSVKLVYHRKAAEMRCHHCGHIEAPPTRCPTCGNLDLQALGEGTQRIEDTLELAFPRARIVRIDRDAMRRRGALDDTLAKVHAGEADILVGTQLLAKGHDFPNITLVGILNADAALVSPDFRASERLFALLLQVAGRAGRGERPGEVLIQTEFPEHPFYAMLLRQDYGEFARHALLERRLTEFPPFVYQAVLRAESLDEAAVQRFVERAAECARALRRKVTVYEPVAAPLARLSGRTRMQLLVQARSRKLRQEFLHAWQKVLGEDKSRKVKWALDVDPLEL